MIHYIFHNEYWTAMDYVGAAVGDGLIALLAYMLIAGLREAWSKP